MTDSELLMLEQLTYFTDDQLKAAGATKTLEQCDTVGEFLAQFDEAALARLEAGDVDKLKQEAIDIIMSGNMDDEAKKRVDEINKELEKIQDNREWAARIRYMKGNGEICALIFKEYNSEVKCLLFEDPENPGHAIVAFRGTSGAKEWIDDAEGLNRADTECQIKAKEYIESLDYDSVTVTGHSKGGNKAMYVAVTCDKVDRCVSYDGQGFSREFLDKYSVEVQENAHKIKNYSLSTDYVHILMFQIPGSEQIYMEPGNCVDKIGGGHYPMGPFRIYEKDGKYYIDEDGGIIHIGQEEPAMTVLHYFTVYLMNNMSAEELEEVVAFVSLLLAGMMAEDNFNIMEYVESHQDQAVMVLAWLLRFLTDNGLGVDYLLQVCELMGISEDQLYDMIAGMGIPRSLVGRKFLEIIFDNITDGGEDHIIAGLIKIFGGKDSGKINAWWKKIEEEYKKTNPAGDVKEYQIKIRDYSIKVYDAIMSVIESFEQSILPDAGSWNAFSGASWFSRIGISVAVQCINGYNRRLTAINEECRKRVNNVFDIIEGVDKTYSKKMESTVSSIRTLSMQIQQV